MTILSASALPERFEDVEHLDEVMTRPSEAVVADMGRLEGDILILGASGQLGQTICGLAKRAAPDKRIIGVARFGQPGIKERLDSWGVETVTCDLLDRTSVANLPRFPNVVYAVGGRFGPIGDRELAWMTNTCVPANVAESFVGCRMVIFSSGTVYPLFSILSQGAMEDVAPARRQMSSPTPVSLVNAYSSISGKSTIPRAASSALPMRTKFDTASCNSLLAKCTQTKRSTLTLATLM